LVFAETLHAGAHSVRDILLLGLVFYESGRYNEAVIELRQAVRLSPDNAAWHYRLFNAYVREKEPAQADLELKTFKALRAKSTNQGDGMDSPAR
jgi:cytochrome c-type biogenesis protein CcmH/NrfG